MHNGPQRLKRVPQCAQTVTDHRDSVDQPLGPLLAEDRGQRAVAVIATTERGLQLVPRVLNARERVHGPLCGIFTDQRGQRAIAVVAAPERCSQLVPCGTNVRDRFDHPVSAFVADQIRECAVTPVLAAQRCSQLGPRALDGLQPAEDRVRAVGADQSPECPIALDCFVARERGHEISPRARQHLPLLADPVSGIASDALDPIPHPDPELAERFTAVPQRHERGDDSDDAHDQQARPRHEELQVQHLHRLRQRCSHLRHAHELLRHADDRADHHRRADRDDRDLQHFGSYGPFFEPAHERLNAVCRLAERLLNARQEHGGRGEDRGQQRFTESPSCRADVFERRTNSAAHDFSAAADHVLHHVAEVSEVDLTLGHHFLRFFSGHAVVVSERRLQADLTVEQLRHFLARQLAGRCDLAPDRAHLVQINASDSSGVSDQLQRRFELATGFDARGDQHRSLRRSVAEAERRAGD